MQVKGIIDEDFVNYKKPSMYIAFPYCNFKCEKECGLNCCQNSELARAPNINITTRELCERYLLNPITQAIVCGGLEPFDSFDSGLYELINTLRLYYKCDDDIVIYTGYTENECNNGKWLPPLQSFKNIIVKFGRFIPNQQPHFDKTLGVDLQSNNQYSKHLV